MFVMDASELGFLAKSWHWLSVMDLIMTLTGGMNSVIVTVPF